MLTDEDKEWISQQLEAVETKLLTAFHRWGSPVEIRQRSHAAVLRALDVEMESVQDRLNKLEGSN
jgi:hypothetical protein